MAFMNSSFGAWKPLDADGLIVKMRRHDLLYLCGFTAILGCAAYYRGGFLEFELNYVLLGLGLLTGVYWIVSPGDSSVPAMDRRLSWSLITVLFYVAFQLVPLPVWLLQILSPARAEHLKALDRVVPVTWGSLSVMPGATMAHLFRLAAYALVLVTACRIATHHRSQPWVTAFPILVVGSLEALLGLLQYLAGTGKSRLAQGTYPNHSHFADLLDLILPFAIMGAIALARRESRSASTLLSTALMAIAAVIMFLAIVCTLSGSGFISCLAGLMFMAIIGTNRTMGTGLRWGTIAAVIVLTGVAFFLLPLDPVVERFAGEARLEEGSRPSLWGDALKVVRVYPIFGSGLGTFEEALYQHSTVLHDLVIDYAHNDYLQLLVELGSAGFLIGCALAAAVVQTVLRRALRDSRPENRAHAIAATAALAAFAIHCFYNFNFYAPANALTAAYIAGISLYD